MNILLLNTLLLSCALYCNGPELPDRYTVHFEEGTKRVGISAEITLEDSLLYMSPYGPMPDRWDDYIRNIRLHSESGKPLSVHRTADSTWVLNGITTGERVKLEYDIALDHEAVEWPGGIDGVAYVREWGVMASGRSLFLMNGHSKEDITLSFRHPGAWKVSAPWKLSDASAGTYRVPNLTSLQESFIFAGTHQEMRVEREGFVLKFILGGPGIQSQQETYKGVALGVLDYYIRQMDGIPKPPPGQEFDQSMVIISASGHLDGEVIGTHLSMFMNPQGDPMEQLVGWFMFAHEFFHLWNGKTLRFSDTQTDWFKEGVSNYYTLKALHQIGLATEPAIFGILDDLFYKRYVNDPGFGTLAPAKAASGFDKDNHWGLIYGGGLFTGLSMDLEIRHKTKNRKSLDDLMRYLYLNYGGSDRLIDEKVILELANGLGKTDFTGLLQSCIQGTGEVPLARYLEYAGLEAETESGQLLLRHSTNPSAIEKDIWEGVLGGN